MKLRHLSSRCFWLGLLPFTVGSSLSSDIDKVLPLPQWVPTESQSPPVLSTPAPLISSPLIPDALLTEEDVQDLKVKMESSPPNLAEEIRNPPEGDFDLSLFLPDSLLVKAVQSSGQTSPTPPSEYRILDQAFLDFCRASPREISLIDPDTQVSETQREDLMRFLEFHNRDAKISACIVVTDRDQVLPEGVDLSRIASGMLQERDSCLVVYPLGEPWRARLFLSNSVHKKAGADYLQSLIEDCANDAREVTDPLEQLHRFTVRLSIRLFWLEKVTHAPAVAAAKAPMTPPSQEFTESREAALTQAILETDTVSSNPPAGNQTTKATVFVATLIGGVIGIVGLLAFGYRRRQMRHRIWLLPEVEMPVRLGGTFSGGGGAFVKYR